MHINNVLIAPIAETPTDTITDQIVVPVEIHLIHTENLIKVDKTIDNTHKARHETEITTLDRRTNTKNTIQNVVLTNHLDVTQTIQTTLENKYTTSRQ